MLTLIKNGEVYAPDFLGKKDILLAGGKIAYISREIAVPKRFAPIEIIDAKGKLVIPGLIDGHVHIIGGGGEGGFKTRTPELNLTDAVIAGITTVVGVIGTDGTTRTMADLIAKARALEEEGISCFVLTGSYQVPVKILTGKIEDDLILIDKIIGVGEIAISDHRSSQPTAEDLAKIASSARIGGLLSGKGGVVNIHVGDGKRKLSQLEAIIQQTEIPVTQFWPTHINRNESLLEAGIQYAKAGGYVDLTASSMPNAKSDKQIKASFALKQMLDAGVDISKISMTSDGQGSLPRFDKTGRFADLQVAKVASLTDEIRSAVLDLGIPLETALKTATKNPAKVLKLEKKGVLEEGKDADVVLLNKQDLTVDTVIAMGKLMVKAGKPVVKGTFE